MYAQTKWLSGALLPGPLLFDPTSARLSPDNEGMRYERGFFSNFLLKLADIRWRLVVGLVDSVQNLLEGCLLGKSHRAEENKPCRR